MDDVLGVVWLIGLTTVLPLLAIWFSTRKKINETNKRQEILMAVLEKNPDMDVEQWLEKLSPKKKLLKEKLLTKLLWGIICLIAGLGIIGASIYGAIAFPGRKDETIASSIFGGGILAIGIALVTSFFVGKKFLAKEIEAEEKQKIQE